LYSLFYNNGEVPCLMLFQYSHFSDKRQSNSPVHPIQTASHAL